MTGRHRFLTAGLVVASLAAAAAGDGMIVPVRPEVRVRGSWSVKYHRVHIRVRDQVASVSIDQAFVNHGSRAMEVEYLFPIPPHAAIDSMTMIVNGQEFAGRILQADEARKVYEDIVRRKRDPALLEYAGFGLYKTLAFPLEPGKPCKVVVHYNDVCKKDRDLVEVWYPLNTEKFSAKPIEDVTVQVDIKAAADISAVYSPTHDLKTQRKGPRQVIATYHATNTLPLTDFQVFYKASNDTLGATLLTHQPEPKSDGYFLMLVSPNPRLSENKVVPKTVVLVFDHSGSMSGKKIEQAKGAAAFVLRNLNGKDKFNVIAYSDAVESFFDDELVAATKENIAEALDRLDRLDATGGTNIHEALQTAMGLCGADRGRDRPRYVIFLTDGKPTVGKKDTATIVADTKSANKSGARLFAFGVGYSPNVLLLDKLVADNGGRSDYVKQDEPIEAKVSGLYAKIKNPVMTGVKLSLERLRLVDMYPREVGDLFDGDQIVVVGRYDASSVRKLPKRDGKHTTTLVVSGMYEGHERAFEYNVTVRPPGRDSRFGFVEKLWAIRRVGWLLDQIQLNGQSKELIDEVVRLGKRYGIMTPYTSFLADERTELADARALGKGVVENLRRVTSTDGVAGQMEAKARKVLREADVLPGAAASGEIAATGPARGAEQLGWDRAKDYESGRKQQVANVRNVGNTALYRRGRLWRTAETTEVDLKRDAEKIAEVSRFTEEYFALVRANTAEENQVLASQAADEELLIRLRGQVYRIK